MGTKADDDGDEDDMYKFIDFVVFAPVEFITIYLFNGLVSDMFLLTQPKLVEEDWTLRPWHLLYSYADASLRKFKFYTLLFN